MKDEQVLPVYQEQQINGNIPESYLPPFREPSMTNTLPMYNSSYNEKLTNPNVLSNNYTTAIDNPTVPFNKMQNTSTTINHLKVNENVNNSLTNEIEMNLICGEVYN